MADYYMYMQELDDVHRWLPSEILKDIGITDPADGRHVAVVEDLAVRLAGVLGGTRKTAQQPHSYRQGRGLDGRDVLAGGRNVHRAAAPPFSLASPAVPWQAMEGLRNNMAALPRFAPASPLGGGAQPTTRRSGGTGVFLPRTEVRCAPRSQGNEVKPTRRCRAQKHRRGEEAAMTKQQQELQAMAAKMEQRQQCIHACPELALPEEWTY